MGFGKPVDPASVPCTNFRLRRLVRVVGRRYDTEIQRAGLKSTQYSLLAHVAALGPVQPAELARHLAMDASTLSRNLGPLLAAGWIERQPGADARSRRLALTEAGESKRLEARRHWRRAQSELERELGPERVAALHALIDTSLGLLGGDTELSADARP
jgi:DNA-binding MarR family transcriptional regulator